MYVEESGRVFVDIFDPRYTPALQDFLISCFEPVCRTQQVNEYALTPQSLSAAAAEGTYSAAEIRTILLKTASGGCLKQEKSVFLPATVENMLHNQIQTSHLRLILQQKCGSEATSTNALAFYLASYQRNYLEDILNANAGVRECLEPVLVSGVPQLIFSALEEAVVSTRQFGSSARHQGLAVRVMYKAQVKDGMLRELRRQVQSVLGVYIDCFYDYASDKSSPSVPRLALNGDVRLRPYQVASLERFQKGSKAHSGVVVLPCGAGKTLTGIAASTVLGKKTIVMCVNRLSVLQWRDQFLRWTNLSPSQITLCTKEQKDMPGDIFLTTYSMLTAKQPVHDLAAKASAGGVLTEKEQQRLDRAAHKKAVFQAIQTASWGLLILDEVHVVPAETFQLVIDKVKHHCVLGLSATLLREDQKVANLDFLIGPKLYEANWLELTRAGHLAPVECAEVRCPLPSLFLSRYVEETAGEVLTDIESMNPYKVWCTQALVEFHCSRSPPDKIIIFCDSIPAVKYYAHKLGVPFMDGTTHELERSTILDYFRKSPLVNTIILSRVGDIALDLPEATVIIQISSMGASRRQEAQRLGRILRPKPPASDTTCAYFYTLVSADTDELRHSFGRQEWLRNQGFSYRVLSSDDVLRPFYAKGCQPVCVGEPKWCHTTHTNKWAPFDSKSAELIERAFYRGTGHVTLSSIGATVQFDSSDVPSTFGVVAFESLSAPESEESKGPQVWEARVRRGPLADHRCSDNECFPYALLQAGIRRETSLAAKGNVMHQISGSKRPRT